MKSVVGVYESHEKAVQAINDLKKAGCPAKKLSLLSKADIINNHIRVKANHKAEKAEVSLGLLGGIAVGILSGVGVFAIPGLGFIFGAGALVGAFAGFDMGIIGGGLVAILTGIGIDEAVAQKYEKHLNEGKFLVFAQGSDEEVEKAQKVLHTNGMHMELDFN